MKKCAVLLLFLLGISLFTAGAAAESTDIGIAYEEQQYPAAAESFGVMNFHISFGGTDQDEVKNAAVTLAVYDGEGAKLDVLLTKTGDKTETGSREGQAGYQRTCSFSGVFPIGENYTIEADVTLGGRELSELNSFDVCPMRRVSGTIRLPSGERAASPIECRILFLEKSDLSGDKAVFTVPTAITAMIPAGEDSVEYHYDYSVYAHDNAPFVIDCRALGDSRFTEENFYTGSFSSPYWYQAAQVDVSQKDSAGIDFTLAKADKISGTFTLPRQPEKSGPTLSVIMRAYTDMGTSAKNDDVTVEKEMEYHYGETNGYTLSVPQSPSGYIVSYHLKSSASYPYVYNGVQTSGYYSAGGIRQLKAYAETLPLKSGGTDGIDFLPAAYDFEGLSDASGHWAAPYIYEMTARGIFSAKGSPSTFRPDDTATRGECVQAAARLFGLTDAEPVQVFGDVTTGSEYFGAVSAAYRAGLINGCADGGFHPEAPVSRQDAELMLYRGIVGYFKLDPTKIETSPVGDPSSISDQEDIASYARDAVSFCFKYYINMFKNDHCSNPQYLMSRCDLASEFYRCLNFLNGN